MPDDATLARFLALETWELERVVREGRYRPGSREALAIETALAQRKDEERASRDERRAEARARKEAERAERQRRQQEEARQRRKEEQEQERERRKRDRDRRRAEAAGARALLFSERARRTYLAAAPSRREEYRDVLAKLRTSPVTDRQQVGMMGRDMGDCAIFPKGHNSVRIFFYDHGDDTIRVCEIGSKYDGTYERLWSHGVYRADYPDADFAPLDLGDDNMAS